MVRLALVRKLAISAALGDFDFDCAGNTLGALACYSGTDENVLAVDGLVTIIWTSHCKFTFQQKSMKTPNFRRDSRKVYLRYRQYVSTNAVVTLLDWDLRPYYTSTFGSQSLSKHSFITLDKGIFSTDSFELSRSIVSCSTRRVETWKVALYHF